MSPNHTRCPGPQRDGVWRGPRWSPQECDQLEVTFYESSGLTSPALPCGAQPGQPRQSRGRSGQEAGGHADGLPAPAEEEPPLLGAARSAARLSGSPRPTGLTRDSDARADSGRWRGPVRLSAQSQPCPGRPATPLSPGPGLRKRPRSTEPVAEPHSESQRLECSASRTGRRVRT